MRAGKPPVPPAKAGVTTPLSGGQTGVRVRIPFFLAFSCLVAPLTRGERASRAGGWFGFANQPDSNPPFACGSRPPYQGGKKQRGFTYLGLLLIVAAMGFGMAAFGEFASNAAQREKEA